MIWNSIISAKRGKTELHVIWLDLANAYSSVPNHLALDFFNFPCEVGKITMKYFNSAFMTFTVKDYNNKWQALEIGIMMGCVISSLLFVLATELILQGTVNTSKGVMTNKHLTLPPSRAFMDEITILVPSKIATTKVQWPFHRGRIKAKPKKNRSISLVGGPDSCLEGSWINWLNLSTQKDEGLVLPTWSFFVALIHVWDCSISRWAD